MKTHCSLCGKKTNHRFIGSQGFLTKWRTINQKFYECELCKNKKQITKEVQNEKVCIWD